jgi:hypothetical protein
MFNTIKLTFNRIDKLQEEQRQRLREKLGLWLWQPIVEEHDSWQMCLHPTNMINLTAITYLLNCYQPLADEFPTVAITAQLCEEPASVEQCQAVRTQLLEEWRTICVRLSRRIEANTKPSPALNEVLGKRSAYERAIRELERLPELSAEALMRLRNSVLFGEYILAVQTYQQRKPLEGVSPIMEYFTSLGRCDAYALILREITWGFRLPDTLPLTHDIEKESL